MTEGIHYFWTSSFTQVQSNILRNSFKGACQWKKQLKLAKYIVVLFQVVRKATGKCHETMTRKFWEVGDFIGRTAQVKLVDFSSGSWGHINFDDLRGDITCSAPENTGTYISVGFKSFKLRYPMCVYRVATQTSRQYEWLD